MMFNRLFRRRGRAAPAPNALPDARGVLDFVRSHMPEGGYTAADRRRDFLDVFESTPAGRRVFSQILARSRVCAGSYMPGDACETARREGMRDIGLWLLDQSGDAASDRSATAEAEPVPDGPRR